VTLSVKGFGPSRDPDTIFAPDRYPYLPAPAALTANRAYFAMILPPYPITLDEIRFLVTTGSGVAIGLDVGIYDGSLQLLASVGAGTQTLTSNTVSGLFLGVDVLLEPGFPYYLALASDSALPSLWAATWPGTAGGQFFGSGMGDAAAFERDASYPLPADASSATVSSAVPILLGT
jgi:hypothetical protein